MTLSNPPDQPNSLKPSRTQLPQHILCAAAARKPHRGIGSRRRQHPAVAARSGSRPGAIQGMIDDVSLGLDTTIDSPVVRKLVRTTVGARAIYQTGDAVFSMKRVKCSIDRDPVGVVTSTKGKNSHGGVIA